MKKARYSSMLELVPDKPGTVLKIQMALLGLSPKEVAQLAGVYPAEMYDILSGRRRITFKMALKFENVLSVSAETLLISQLKLDLSKYYGS